MAIFPAIKWPIPAPPVDYQLVGHDGSWTSHNGILPPGMVGILAFLKWVCSLESSVE